MSQMKYYYELTISSSPHAHTANTTQTIMRDALCWARYISSAPGL